jgi:hypothetical protein
VWLCCGKEDNCGSARSAATEGLMTEGLMTEGEDGGGKGSRWHPDCAASLPQGRKLRQRKERRN